MSSFPALALALAASLFGSAAMAEADSAQPRSATTQETNFEGCLRWIISVNKVDGFYPPINFIYGPRSGIASAQFGRGRDYYYLLASRDPHSVDGVTERAATFARLSAMEGVAVSCDGVSRLAR